MNIDVLFPGFMIFLGGFILFVAALTNMCPGKYGKFLPLIGILIQAIGIGILGFVLLEAAP